MTTYVAKMPDEQGHIDFTDQEHAVWQTLITRQCQTIEDRACPEFIQGITKLRLVETHIPTLAEVNAALACTRWTMIPVHGTIHVTEFFAMLKRREFPVATFIRIPEELDYLKQPDIFHEYFGHGPLLTNPAYADFVQWYGAFASTVKAELPPILGRLFWFTIEFGLLQSADGLRIYGGGILSSHQETIYAVESPEPARKPFNLQDLLRTAYDYTVIQDTYFIIESLDALYKLMDERLLLDALRDVEDEQASFNIC